MKNATSILAQFSIVNGTHAEVTESLIKREVETIQAALEAHLEHGDASSGMALRNAIVNSALGATFPEDNDLGLEGYALQLIALCAA